MLTQIKNARFYLQAKLGLSQRGAEMVEYAIVLACIAAVGVYFYSVSKADTAAGSVAKNGLSGVLEALWKQVAKAAGVTVGS